MPAIDYDKGVWKRKHPMGLDVYMYVTEPGVFRNAHGAEVDPDLAKEAGFETESLLKERARRERVAEAEAAINDEFSFATERKVVAKLNGYQIVRVRDQLHQVLDPDGNVMTGTALLSKDQAVRIAGKMTSAKKPEPKPEPKVEEGAENAEAE